MASCRALVDLQAGEVLLHDEPRRVARAVAALLVHGRQQVERVHQDVAAAARRVQHADVLRALDADEVLGLPLRLDVVAHALAQGAAGVVEHPQAAQRVLHHVAHDPLGREELRGGAYLGHRLGLALLLEAREDLVLHLGVVELVRPADDLHRLPLGIGQVLHQPAADAAGGQQVVRQHEGVSRVERAEHAGHGLGQLGALGKQDPAEERLVGARRLELQHLRAVEPRQVERGGLRERLRAGTALRVAEDAGAAGQEVVRLHVADGHQAVEPERRHLLHEGVLSRLAHAAQQRGALGALRLGDGAAGHLDELVCGGGVVAEEPVALGAQDHALAQRRAGPDGELLDGGGVHGNRPSCSFVMKTTIWQGDRLREREPGYDGTCQGTCHLGRAAG